MDHFGKQLLAAGYNYWGNEPMYSGITGEEFAADIYLGVVYYQRLRHMVNDKFQVRTTGPVDPVTRQPVKVWVMSPVEAWLQALSYFHRVGNVGEGFVLVKWNVMLSSRTEHHIFFKTDS